MSCQKRAFCTDQSCSTARAFHLRSQAAIHVLRTCSNQSSFFFKHATFLHSAEQQFLWLTLESEEGEANEAADQEAMSAIIQALLGCKHSLQGELIR